MRRSLKGLLAYPFYVWLLGLHPILYLYSQNLGLVIDHEVVIVLGWMLGAVTLAFVCTNVLLKDRFRAASLVGFAIVFFALSGHIYGLLLAPTAVHLEIEIALWTQFVMAAAVGVLFITYRMLSTDLLRRVTKIINLIMIVMLIAPSSAIATHLAADTTLVFESMEDQPSAVSQQTDAQIHDSPSHPDIYYIVPDGYPSNRWLQEAMNYDNAEFTRALESRGFVVVDHAQSNYGATLHSLAATLNAQYYDSNDSAMKDLEFLRVQIAENEVALQLRERGYTYIQLLSGYLLPSPLAHINRDFTPNGTIDITIDRSELLATAIGGHHVGENNTVELDLAYKQSFIRLYVDSTLLRGLSSGLLNDILIEPNRPYGLSSPQRFLRTVDEVTSIALMPEATFALIHLMKPHAPTSFNAQGEIVAGSWFPSHEQYFSDFAFVNETYLWMIDSILEQSTTPPIIIFQADHGSTYGSNWASDRRLVHFDAFAAYHLPDTYVIRFPEPFTFVNTFPLVLNEVFGTEMTLLEDRLIDLPSGYDTPFVQIDVTDEFIH